MNNPASLAARRAPEAWKAADALAQRLRAAKSAPLRARSVGRERAEELVQRIRDDRAARRR